MTFIYCEKRGIRLTLEVCKARGCAHADKAEEINQCPFISAKQRKIDLEARKREAAKKKGVKT